ncbi:MAG TPA: glycosyltransferase family 2 protein [Candidatus Omnitrophota bacterium]|nr:glycosyltransferase family 2 protein [Candidatus Omnitrophota bacterium]HPD84432.1 glycosyltransferase family 2 protein [Candidatus Omnitrophota bacterium]HRZ03290.1 glycosyltransferase family 2 protein [Candidatus Omnitrophota bacterium]
MAKISFVLPFYNEEQTLPLLIGRIREIMAKEPEDYEMIFINDDSKDSSVKVIADQAKQKGKGKIILVDMSRRFGLEESIMAGISQSKGDAVITMFTDMQDPPETVARMLQSWRAGADIVHTVRRKRIKESPLKILAAFFAYRIIGNLSEIKIPYDAGDFKLISKNAAKHLSALTEAEPYLRGLVPWLGFKQAYIEYEMQPRAAGQSKMPVFGFNAWSRFLGGIITFSDFPAYLILLVGLLGTAASAVLAILLVLGVNLAWCGTWVVLVVFLWATLMIALGILSLYALKIYKNTRGRPRYIIKNINHFED